MGVKTWIISALLFSQSTGHAEPATYMFFPPVTWWLKLRPTCSVKSTAVCFGVHSFGLPFHIGRRSFDSGVPERVKSPSVLEVAPSFRAASAHGGARAPEMEQLHQCGGDHIN